MVSWDIEVSEKMYEVISELFAFSGMSAPEVITSNDLNQVVNRMKIIASGTRLNNSTERFAVINDKIKCLKSVKKALIISDTGIVRYQIKVLLNNNGIEAKTVVNCYNGLAEYIKGLYDLVIIDFENAKTLESLKVIDEIKRLACKYSVDTSVIVLCPSKFKALKNKQNKFGINLFIEKIGNWYEVIENEIKKVALTTV